MDWIVDQAFVRMKLESKWPFPRNVEPPRP
jgi:hypothetical protein